MAQHYGLPTRLLDWTDSLLAATYFAVSHESQQGQAAVWALVPGLLNSVPEHSKNVTYVLQGPESKFSMRAAFGLSDCKDEVLAVLPVDLDLRMTVQLGCFTIHATNQPLEQRPKANEYLAKFTIPADARKALQDELWVLGIRRAALFSDLSNRALDLSTNHRLVPTIKQKGTPGEE